MPKRVLKSGPRRHETERGLLPTKRHDSMQEFLEDRLRKLPELELRSMFGGAGIYAEETMLGIVHRGRVYLKTNSSTRGAFVQRGMKAFQPPRGAVLKSYYEVPPDILDDEAELVSWARRALAVAATPSRTTNARMASPSQILESYSSAPTVTRSRSR
jgi:DNA transformation protein